MYQNELDVSQTVSILHHKTSSICKKCEHCKVEVFSLVTKINKNCFDFYEYFMDRFSLKSRERNFATIWVHLGTAFQFSLLEVAVRFRLGTQVTGSDWGDDAHIQLLLYISVCAPLLSCICLYFSFKSPRQNLKNTLVQQKESPFSVSYWKRKKCVQWYCKPEVRFRLSSISFRAVAFF